jgi:hypothetical protein
MQLSTSAVVPYPAVVAVSFDALNVAGSGLHPAAASSEQLLYCIVLLLYVSAVDVQLTFLDSDLCSCAYISMHGMHMHTRHWLL